MIAEAHEAIAMTHEEMSLHQRIKAEIEAHTDSEIALDAGLKNDSQRRSRRWEMLATNGQYMTTCTTLERLEVHLRVAQIEYERLKNEFKVARINALVILASDATAELIGLIG